MASGVYFMQNTQYDGCWRGGGYCGKIKIQVKGKEIKGGRKKGDNCIKNDANALKTLQNQRWGRGMIDMHIIFPCIAYWLILR